ncbi:hypothetical protein KBA73_05540 [Patescibacteria group bacterium]|nr:hypothetical protein [Patescibacteria group bacterium]
MKRFRTLAIAATTAASFIGMGVGILHAAPTTTAHANPMSSLVTAIAQKFNLNTADVQTVFDAERTQHEAEKETRVKTHLDAEVVAGTLTQAQEDALIAKQKEVKAFMETLKDKTDAERETALKTQKEALDQWVKDSGIPAKYTHLLTNGPRGHRGPGGHEGFGERGPRGPQGEMNPEARRQN